MYKLEKRYGERLNFVVLDGAEPRNAELVSKFGVDGIPHLALITGTRKLAGTLVGAVPEAVLEQNFRALAADEPLPYASTNTERSTLKVSQVFFLWVFIWPVGEAVLPEAGRETARSRGSSGMALSRAKRHETLGARSRARSCVRQVVCT